VEKLAMTKAMKLSENGKIALRPPRLCRATPCSLSDLWSVISFGATQGIPGQ
jgi:hypothetical protein